MKPDFESLKRENDARIHEDELLGRAVPTGLPPWVGLYTTTACNLKCVFCLQADGLTPQKRMSREVFGYAARELFPTARIVQFTAFGEPFLTPHLSDVLDIVEWYGVKLDMVTNGTLLMRDDTILRRTADLADQFSFSIDGATPETFNRLRVNADFDEVMQGIIRWNRYRLLKPVEERPLLTLKFIFMRETVLEANALVDIAHALRADEVGFSHLSEHREEVRGSSLIASPRQSNHYLGMARERAEGYGIKFRGPDLFCLGANVEEEDPSDWPEPMAVSEELLDRIRAGIPEPCEPGGGAGGRPWQGQLPPLASGDPRCYFLWRRTYVDPEGHVIQCFHPDGERMGNIREQPFWRIWTSPRFEEYRRRVYSSSPIEICDNCFIIRKVGRRKDVFDAGTHNEAPPEASAHSSVS